MSSHFNVTSFPLFDAFNFIKSLHQFDQLGPLGFGQLVDCQLHHDQVRRGSHAGGLEETADLVGLDERFKTLVAPLLESVLE